MERSACNGFVDCIYWSVVEEKLSLAKSLVVVVDMMMRRERERERTEMFGM